MWRGHASTPVAPGRWLLLMGVLQVGASWRWSARFVDVRCDAGSDGDRRTSGVIGIGTSGGAQRSDRLAAEPALSPDQPLARIHPRRDGRLRRIRGQRRLERGARERRRAVRGQGLRRSRRRRDAVSVQRLSECRRSTTRFLDGPRSTPRPLSHFSDSAGESSHRKRTEPD